MLHAVIVPLLVLCFLIAPTLLFSQEFTIHPVGGYEYGALLSIQRDRGAINDGRTEGFGKSSNHTFWVGVENEAAGLLHDDIALSARISLAFGSGGFLSRPYNDTAAIDRSTGLLTPSLNEFQIDATETNALGEAIVSYNVTNRWLLRGGAWMQYRIASDFVQTERVVSPSSLVFPENTTAERVIQSGSALSSGNIKYGFLLGIARDIPISRGFTLRPELLARCDMNALGRDLGLRSFMFGGSMSVSLDLGDDPLELDRPPATSDTTIVLTGRSKIDAMVDLFSVDTLDVRSDTAIIQTEHTLYRSFLQLPTVIFFDKGSDTIPARFASSGDTIGTLSSVSPAGRDPVAIYRNLLDIIGRRLLENESWSVRLEGFTGAGETATLARRRAERIQNYLNEIWTIDRSRMKITEGTSPCRQYIDVRHGGVEIASPTPQVIAPVLYQWAAETYAVPHIGLSRKISSALGVRDWRVVVTRGNEEIAVFSSEDALSSSVDVNLAAARLSSDSLFPITAALTVTDYSGTSVTVRDELPLRFNLADTARPREIRAS
jgi:hypothetical protein